MKSGAHDGKANKLVNFADRHQKRIVCLATFLFSWVIMLHILSITPILLIAATNTTADLSLLPELYKRLQNSVVQIETQKGEQGSGFIYDSHGHIVTNFHVVNGSDTGFVSFVDGNSYLAKLIGKDQYSDLAVLQLDPPAVLREKPIPIPLGNSSQINVGQQVIAIGNPLGLSGSMSHGIISQLDRLIAEGRPFSIPGAIQTDAPVNQGNSGGPLLNLAGQVIGVTTFGLQEGASTGLNFAISSNTIEKVVPQLILHGTYKHPWIGFKGENIDPIIANHLGLKEAKGVHVIDVTPGDPAQLAGVMVGDILFQIDDKEVRKVADVLNYLESKSVGDAVVLKVLRIGSVHSFDIKLVERPTAYVTAS